MFSTRGAQVSPYSEILETANQEEKSEFKMDPSEFNGENDRSIYISH